MRHIKIKYQTYNTVNVIFNKKIVKKNIIQSRKTILDNIMYTTTRTNAHY